MRVFICLFIFSAFISKAQTTILLPTLKDAAIGFHDNTNGANTNYGTAAQNAAYLIPGSAGPLNGNRALIAFDLTQIPTGASIVSAKLNLYAYGPIGSYPGHTGSANSAYLQRVTQAWQESVVTWSTQPASTPVNEVTLSPSSSPTQDYLNIDVKQLVNDMIANPSTSDGFLLKLVNEATTNILAFCSRENPNPSKAPTLEVVYNVACSDSLSVIADYDAAIGFHDNTNTANMNYGTASQNAAYWIPGSAGPVNGNRALIHFDLSTIPPGATITGAFMNLYAYGPIGSYPGHVGANSSYLQRVTQTWQESAVTWSTQPASIASNQVTLPASTSSTQDYLNINVTNLIADIYASGANNGMLLKLISEQTTNILAFCSKDHATVAKHPTLRVTYTCAPASVSELHSGNLVLKLFPNPAQNTVDVVLPDNKLALNAEVYVVNQLGQTVLNVRQPVQSQHQLSLDISSLAPGIYFVKIKTEAYSGEGKLLRE